MEMVLSNHTISSITLSYLGIFLPLYLDVFIKKDLMINRSIVL